MRLQHAIATALDGDTPAPGSRVVGRIAGEAAEIWYFLDASRRGLDARRVEPRRHGGARARAHDYAIVACQRVDLVYARLVGPLAAAGIRLRNKNQQVGRLTVQDVMAEPLTRMALDILDVVVRPPAPLAWVAAVDAVRDLRAVAPADEVGLARVDRELTAFVRVLHADIRDHAVSGDVARTVGARVI